MSALQELYDILYSLLTRIHSSTLSFTPSNDSERHHDNEIDPIAQNQSHDEGSGNDVNVSHILALFRRLTSVEQSELYKQLGIRHESEIYRFLGFNEQPEISMEEQMMQHMEYRIHKFLLLYIPPIIIILGTFGNMFAFIILKNKAMLKFSTYFFLMVMAVADTLVLYIGLFPLWIGEMSLNPRDQADWTCKLSNAIGSTVSDYSVWLIVAVTAERYLVVCYPFRAGHVCSTPRARRLVTVLFAAFLALNAHFFWSVGIVHYAKGGRVCTAASSTYDRLVKVIWPWVDAFVYSFLPFVVILCLNILIVRQVIIARGQRENLHGSNKFRQRRPSQEGSTRLTLMLLTISFTFLVTTLPLNVVSIAAAFIDNDRSGAAGDSLRKRSSFKLARTVAEMLMYANHAINFYLYCATGQKFRHQLVWMVCYARRSCGATETTAIAVDNGDRLTSVGAQMVMGSIQHQHQLHHQPKQRIMSGNTTQGYQIKMQQKRQRFSGKFGGCSDGCRMHRLLAGSEPSPLATVNNSRNVKTTDNKTSASIAVVAMATVSPTDLNQTSCRVETEEHNSQHQQQQQQQLSPNVVTLVTTCDELSLSS